jgi:hypothetical protein
VTAKFATLFADLLGGTWFSSAFRTPEVFGMDTVFKQEAIMMAHFMQACRLVFESCLLCRTLPTSTIIDGFDLVTLNEFISSQTQSVLAFYTELVESVRINEVSLQPLKEYR